MRKILIVVLMLLIGKSHAQQNVFSLVEAIDYALKNNASLRAAGYDVASRRELRKASFDLPKTEVSLLYGQYNSYVKNDNNFTVTQAIPFSAFGSHGKLNRSLIASSELRKAQTENELVFRIKQAYNRLLYAYSLRKLLLQQDSIFEGFYKSASLRYKVGETKLLEQSTAEAQRTQAKIRFRENESDIAVLRSQLRSLLNAPATPDTEDQELSEILSGVNLDTTLLSANPSLAYARQQIEVAKNEKKVQSARFAPDFLVGFFSQTLIGTPDPETGAVANGSERFTGLQVGVSIPLWFAPHQARTKAAEFNTKSAESNYYAYGQQLRSQMEQAIQEFHKNRNSLTSFRDSSLPNAELILKQSEASFRGGEIGYAEFLLGLRNAIDIRERYLQTLYDYNQSIILIEFLSGNK